MPTEDEIKAGRAAFIKSYHQETSVIVRSVLQAAEAVRAAAVEREVAHMHHEDPWVGKRAIDDDGNTE